MAGVSEEEVLHLAKATLESDRHLRVNQKDDGHDEVTPLVTGKCPSKTDVAHCLFNHPEIDHDLRIGMMWLPTEDTLLRAVIITFNENHERNAIKRVAYANEA